MALLQLSEPGQSSAPHQHRLAVGIDLGTTNSLVATVRSGNSETLPDEEGRHLLPSVVRYTSDAVIVGDQARASAVTDPLNTISSVKRLLGRGIADINSLGERLPYRFQQQDSSVPRIDTVAGSVTPIEVSAQILKSLAKRAEATLGGQLDGVVITVPAYFDEAQRQATKDAAKLADLKVMRLLNEPTAAAVAYGLDTGSDGIHAVYDLGGGTFDISLLRLHHGVFEVLATGGDSALGGDDMDLLVAEWIMQQAGIRDDASHSQLRELMQQAREAKEQLTEKGSTPLRIRLDNGTFWEGELQRQTFNKLVEPLVRKTITPCRRALRDAGLSVTDVVSVIMVGGSTRVSLVREMVGAFFRTEPLVSMDPDRVVALGAAIQADILVGNKPEDEMLLLDVNPLSLGIETMGGLVEKIIPRNTTIPVSKAQEFTTFKDGQTAMAVHILQGERDLVADNRSLARFELHGIPPMVAGAARIRVTYTVDADGLLRVEARELSTGVEARIEVKPSYGLTDSEIETMLRDSLDHAKEDMCVRRLKEQQVEAERVILALQSALKDDGYTLLKGHERQRIDTALMALIEVAGGGDFEMIRQAMETLEKVSEFYVERRMNASVRKAISGHKVDEFE